MSPDAAGFALMNGNEPLFTPVLSTLGGVVIGLSAGILLLFAGRIAGISGIVGGAFLGKGDRAWRLAFLLGLLVGGALLIAWMPTTISAPSASSAVLVLAGVLVGVGTQLGSGCTSGHGICGLPRLSVRSLVAVATFLGTGAATVLATRLLGGGA